MQSRALAFLQRRIVRVAPATVLLIPLSLTVAATLFAYNRAREDSRIALERVAQRVETTIQARIGIYTDTLLHTRSFFQASKYVSRETFKTFVDGTDVMARHPGMVSVVFIEQFPANRLPKHLEKVRQEGFQNYRVWPEGKRTEYSTVTYVEPSANQRGIGYDMLTEPSRQATMFRARDTGSAAISPKVKFILSQGEHDPHGFILFVPYYKAGAPIATVEQRQAALIGYFSGPFRSEELFNDILKDENHENDSVTFDVYDGQTIDERQLIYRPAVRRQAVTLDKSTIQTDIVAADHHWTLVVQAGSDFQSRTTRYSPLYVLVLGGLVSLLLYLFARMAAKHTEALKKSEAQMRLVTDSLPALVSFVDRNEQYLFTNKAYTDWFGFPEDQLKSRKADELQGKELYQKTSSYIRRALSGERVSFEVDINHKTKGWRTTQIEYIPYVESNGTVAGYVGIGIDITERKQFEIALRDQAERQTFLATVGPVLASSLDSDTILKNLTRLAVPRIADWCGISLLDSHGKLHQLAVAHTDPEKVKWAEELGEKYPPNVDDPHGIAKVIRTGRSEMIAEISDELLVAAAIDDEHLRILRGLGFTGFICVPLKVRGRVIGALSLISAESGKRYQESDLHLAEDLARRASISIENGNLYAEAQAINRIKDEFLATLSHELRTPLNVILGHAEILKMDAPPLGEELDTSIDAIYRNANAQLQIISDLLDVSAIITGKVSFHAALISVHEVAKAAFESIRFAAEAKKIQIEFKSDDHPCYVSGDSTRLQQVLWNLLSNAVKFTPKGGRVVLQTQCLGSKCVVEVCDTGLGIESEFLPFVFDRFRQEDSSMTRRFGGLGLGLSIVKQLVELHGGSVTVESAGKGAGSIFKVSLPLAVASATDTDNSLAHSGRQNSVDEKLAGLKVLIVDDEKDARDLIAKILLRSKTDVRVASSAKEALKEYSRQRPDVMISDIGMPDEDGLSLIRKIRAIESTSGEFTPAAALSAYARPEDKRRALAAGYQIHLSKPVQSVELATALVRLVDGLQH